MESQHYMPHSLSAARLDKYLASGWFRSGETLSRSKMISWDGDVASIINIRINLRYYESPKSFRKILRKNKQQFRVEIVSPNDNYYQEGEENLYQLHKERFHGFVFPTLNEFFYNTSVYWSIFDTKQVKVYDEEKLIATSFFDCGKNSLASIMGIFDPNYSKYSLGIYTMLEEIEYMKRTNRQFYYPGYILDIPSMLDYKLRFLNIEFYDWESKWLSVSKMDRENTPARGVNKTHENIAKLLDKIGVKYTQLMNPLFTVASLMESTSGHQGMLRGAMLFILKEGEGFKVILEYLVDEKLYQISRVREEHAPFFFSFFSNNIWQLNRNNPKIRYITKLFLYDHVYGKHEKLTALVQEMLRNGTIKAK